MCLNSSVVFFLFCIFVRVLFALYSACKVSVTERQLSGIWELTDAERISGYGLNKVAFVDMKWDKCINKLCRPVWRISNSSLLMFAWQWPSWNIFIIQSNYKTIFIVKVKYLKIQKMYFEITWIFRSVKAEHCRK